MNETVRMWTEIVFDLFYLSTTWTLVAVMTYKLPRLPQDMYRLAHVFRTAFFFLVLGDTGLLGSRIIAYAAGGLEYSPAFLGGSIHLAGLGNLSTSITVTFFTYASWSFGAGGILSLLQPGITYLSRLQWFALLL